MQIGSCFNFNFFYCNRGQVSPHERLSCFSLFSFSWCFVCLFVSNNRWHSFASLCHHCVDVWACTPVLHTHGSQESFASTFTRVLEIRVRPSGVTSFYPLSSLTGLRVPFLKGNTFSSPPLPPPSSRVTLPLSRPKQSSHSLLAQKSWDSKQGASSWDRIENNEGYRA